MRRHGPPGGAGWSPHKGEWWQSQSQGQQTWEGFGRGAFFFFLLFLGFVVLVIAGVVTVVTFAISGLQDISTTALLVIGIVFLTLLVLRRIFFRTWRPVRSLINAAGSLADGDYSVRVPPAGSARLRPVVASFNDMARRLEDADEQRRRLLADLGHELRTPLTVIRGEVEAMLDGVHEPDREHLEVLVDEVKVMERLLEDLRTLSQIDAGALDLHPEPTDVGALVADVADAYRRRAAESGVDVVVDADRVIDDVVLDPVRIREVVANLVVNSLRAMPDGGTLRLAARSVGDGAVIEVADNGIGIAPDEVEQMFERFHKGAASPGSGLGLSISRDLVAAHGGELSIESAPGAGTTARVDLTDIAPGVAAP